MTRLKNLNEKMNNYSKAFPTIVPEPSNLSIVQYKPVFDFYQIGAIVPVPASRSCAPSIMICPFPVDPEASTVVNFP